MDGDDPFLKVLVQFFGIGEGKDPKSGRGQAESLPHRGSLSELIDSPEYETSYAGPVEGDAEAEIRDVNGVIRLVIDPKKVQYFTKPLS